MPYIAASANGLFAEFGLDVELLEPAAGPENVRRVAAGGSEFCLTSVTHYLRARAQSGPLAARYAAVVVQDDPMSALVAADSDLTERGQLGGRRLGGKPDNGLVAHYQAGLDELGLDRAQLVDLAYGDAPAALGRGEIDMVADYRDLLPRTARQAGVAVRSVELGLPFYSSGLVAGDQVPADVVSRMVAGICAALEAQRQDPEAGVDAFLRRYPDVDPVEALDGWRLAEPYIFTDVAVGSMDAERWQRTIDFVARAHDFPAQAGATVFRPELAIASV